MLDKEVFKHKIKELLSIYSSWNIKVEDSFTMGLWYRRFKQYENEVFEKAVDDYIDTQKFPPTVASLKQMIPEDDGGKNADLSGLYDEFMEGMEDEPTEE